MNFFYKPKCYKIKCIKFGGNEMEIGYEEKYDQLAIILQNDYEYSHSVEVEANYIIDIDKNNKLVAIEILGCSELIDEDTDYIKNAEINVFVEIYDFSYKIIVDFNNGDKEIVKQVLK